MSRMEHGLPQRDEQPESPATIPALVDRAIAQVAERLEQLSPEILRQFRSPEGIASKGDGSVVTLTDIWVERELTPICLSALPGSFVVGEETVHTYQDEYERILEHEFVWAIDGVDGTHNFSLGLPLFAPSVGLLVKTPQGHVCVGGAVLFPALRELYFMERGSVVQKDLASGERTLLAPPSEEVSARSLLTAPDNLLNRITSGQNGPSPRILGCAVADILYTGRGIFSGTISDYALWDFAGALPLAQALGAHLFNRDTGEQKVAFTAQDFERGTLKRQWCLQDSYLLTRAHNLAAVQGLFGRA